MVALKSERRVFLWRIVPRPKPAEAPAVTLEEVIGILEAEGDGARVFLSEGGRILEEGDAAANDKNQLYIAEIKRSEDGESVTLLINRGDPTTVSPAFIDTERQSVRVEAGGPSEVPGWSAHLVISLTEQNGTHRACFEQMPRLSSSLVLTALDRIVERAIARNPHYRFQVIDQHQGRPRVTWKRYRPTISANRVPSERLVQDLDQGELSGVTLTRRREFYDGPGRDNIIKRQLEKVIIDTRPVARPRMMEFVRQVTEQARNEHFESIQFHIDKLPGDMSNNPTIPLDDQDALEQLYVRAQRLAEFEQVLEQCYGDVCDEIATKMVALLADVDW